MKALSLYRSLCDSNFPFDLGPELGYGVHGEVFELLGQEDHVVKFSVLYDTSSNAIEDEFEKIKNGFLYIKNNNPKPFCRVFDFGFLEQSVRKTVDGNQKYILYYSIQEKLTSLSEDEKKILKTVCDFYNQEIIFNRQISDIISEMSEWLSFDKEQVIKFYDLVISAPIIHHDFHRRNIMKNKSGEFKLIDFDRISVK